MPRQRQGKIARLPAGIREQLNQRLLEGQPASKILPWLNALDETKKVLSEFSEGRDDRAASSAQPISDQNLSEWRKGGYQDWLQRRDRLDHTRELAQFAAKLAKTNGGSIAEGAIAIASGNILELLEACDGNLDPETIGDLLNTLAKFQSSEAAKNRIDLDREKLKRLDQHIELERKKFQHQTGELFIKWFEDKRAKDILGSTTTHTEKLNRIGQLMFGDDWQPNESAKAS